MALPPTRPALMPHPPRRPLSSWIACALVGAVLLTALVLTVVRERFAHIHATGQARLALTQVGWQLRDQLDRGMAEHHAEVVASASRLGTMQDPKAIRLALEALKQEVPVCAWAGFTDASGRVVSATGGLLQGADVSMRPWFQAAQAHAAVVDVHPAKLLEKLLPSADEPWRFVDVAAPVTVDGQLRGVLGVHLSWDWAREIERELLAPALKDHGIQTFVLRADGEVLLGPSELIGTRMDLNALRAEAQAAVSWLGAARHITAVVDTRGHGAYPGLGWVVLVRQPLSIAIASYAQLRVQLLLATAAVCLLMVLLAPRVGQALAQPLLKVTEWLRRADALPFKMRGRSYREAHYLADALEDSRREQARQTAEVRALNESLEAKVAERTHALAQREAESTLARQTLQSVADNVPALVALVDAQLRLKFVNEAYRHWYGVAPADFVGQRLMDGLSEDVVAVLKPHIARVLQGCKASFELHTTQGGVDRFCEVTYVPQFDAERQVSGFIAVTYDVTQLKHLVLQLAREASHDTLTGLPNRRRLMQTLPQALLRAQRSGQAAAVLFLDLNGFKGVNDTHGHDAGDLLLREVAGRLQNCVRRTDTVARLAGDEFVVVLEGLANVSTDIELMSDKIHAHVCQPVRLSDDVEVRVSTSIGVAVYAGQPSLSAGELIAKADAAMYEAKKRRAAKPDVQTAPAAV